MKKLFMLSVLLISAVTFLSSFNSPEVATAAKGGLKVRIKLDGIANGDLSYAPIGISKTQEDLDNGVYVTEQKFTTKEGVADFGQLEAGTYFFDGLQTIQMNGKEMTFYGEGSIEVVAGKTVEGVLLLKDATDEFNEMMGE